MILAVRAQLENITDANLDNIEATEEELIDAMCCVLLRLVDQLHEAKLNRLVRFCQTGTVEHGRG